MLGCMCCASLLGNSVMVSFWYIYCSVLEQQTQCVTVYVYIPVGTDCCAGSWKCDSHASRCAYTWMKPTNSHVFGFLPLYLYGHTSRPGSVCVHG